MLLFLLLLKASSERQIPTSLGLDHKSVLPLTWEVSAVFFKGVLEVGVGGAPMLLGPRKIVLLDSSICWYFANS